MLATAAPQAHPVAPPPALPRAPPPPPPPPPTSLPPPAPGAARGLELRLALSDVAARTLSEPRIRRLVEIETASFAVLAPGPIGPLGDYVAHVWVDQPTASKMVVEVRVADRAVDRREIAVRGLAGDIAARLVAIAVSEMVRKAGSSPGPAPSPPPRPLPIETPEERERDARMAPALMVDAGAGAAALPAVAGIVAGPAVAVGFRRWGVSESIFGRLLEGPTRDSTMRWLELGLDAAYRVRLARQLRLAIGAEGAFAAVHVADATRVEAQAGQRDSWSARAGGKVALELQVARPVWIALDLAPAAILRPVHFTTATAPSSTLEGAWLGFGLSVWFEQVALPDR
jgi:hypothetical protein